MNRQALLLAVGLLMMASGAALAMSGGDFDLPWQAAGSGGAVRASTEYRMQDSIGQSAVGLALGDGAQLRAGYWYGMPVTTVAEVYQLFRRVVASEGGRRSGPDYRAGDTAGQVAIGRAQGGEFGVEAGYWPGVGSLGAAESATPTPTPTPIPGGGYIAGQVDLQGRSNDGGALARASGSETYSATSAANGSFRIETAPGPYTVTVSRYGYLYARRGGVSVSTGATTTLSAVRLLGGDADHDGDCDIYDLTLLGASFGTASVAADISGDGTINVYDLALVGANFGRSAPLPWP